MQWTNSDQSLSYEHTVLLLLSVMGIIAEMDLEALLHFTSTAVKQTHHFALADVTYSW